MDRDEDMTLLEAKITALLADLEKLLMPMDPNANQGYQWKIISKNKSSIKSELNLVTNTQRSLNYNYSVQSSKISALSSYIDANTEFDRDTTFSNASETAGHWGTFNEIIRLIVVESGYYKRKKLSIDTKKALGTFHKLKSLFSTKHHSYTASVRVIGISLGCKKIELPNKLDLKRLTISELNSRQPILDASSFNDQHRNWKLLNDVEASIPITVPVDHSEKSGLFNAHNNAHKVAQEAFQRLQNTLLIHTNGRVLLSPVELSSNSINIIRGGISSVNNTLIAGSAKVLGKDVKKLTMAYELVSGGSKSDQVLKRSLHRFLLGRQRNDVTDKVVDYVIAWEAILLTEKGSSMALELSYRFSINGSSILKLINKLDNLDGYKKMRSAYAVRSCVVHGGTESKLTKELSKGGFSNIHELSTFLETNYQRVLFFLADIAALERPYKSDNGWEGLLWR